MCLIISPTRIYAAAITPICHWMGRWQRAENMHSYIDNWWPWMDCMDSSGRHWVKRIADWKVTQLRTTGRINYLVPSRHTVWAEYIVHSCSRYCIGGVAWFTDAWKCYAACRPSTSSKCPRTKTIQFAIYFSPRIFSPGTGMGRPLWVTLPETSGSRPPFRSICAWTVITHGHSLTKRLHAESKTTISFKIIKLDCISSVLEKSGSWK